MQTSKFYISFSSPTKKSQYWPSEQHSKMKEKICENEGKVTAVVSAQDLRILGRGARRIRSLGAVSQNPNQTQQSKHQLKKRKEQQVCEIWQFLCLVPRNKTKIFVLRSFSWAGEMAQYFRELTALPEDQHWIPSPHMAHRHTSRQNTNTHV